MTKDGGGGGGGGCGFDGDGNGRGDDSNGIADGPGSMYRQGRRLDSVPVFSTDVTRCVLQGGGERER